MKRKRQFETPATIVLGVICAVLFLRLALRVHAVNARTELPVAAPLHTRPRVAAAPPGLAPEAFPQAPALDVELYDTIRNQPLGAAGRDPFALTPTPQQTRQMLQAQQAAAARHNSAPPPPPPVPFQALGFSQNVQGRLEAYLADSDQIYVVHQGDAFDKSYRVLRITPGMIEIQDDSLHRTIGLPFPSP
ncbi:MAG: hypothetical protein ACRD1N_07925 [Terriglobia bacterium]